MASPDVEETFPEVKIPRPRPNGSYSVESLGRFIDRLLGSDKIDAMAAAHLEPLLARDDESESEPEPVDIPEPLPGGTEDIKRGARPTGA